MVFASNSFSQKLGGGEGDSKRTNFLQSLFPAITFNIITTPTDTKIYKSSACKKKKQNNNKTLHLKVQPSGVPRSSPLSMESWQVFWTATVLKEFHLQLSSEPLKRQAFAAVWRSSAFFKFWYLPQTVGVSLTVSTDTHTQRKAIGHTERKQFQVCLNSWVCECIFISLRLPRWEKTDHGIHA